MIGKMSWKQGLVCVVLPFFVSCAKPPTQEMSDAEAAVTAAVQAGAEQYAKTELAAANDALADARAKLESKDYKGAKAAALETKAKADVAQSAVEPNKAAVMTTVQERMNGLKPEIDAVQSAASKLKGRGVEPIKAEAAALTDLWAGVQTAFDGGDYNGALQKLDELQPQLTAARTSVDAAAKARLPGQAKKK
ncbi:MAG TPA: DUF4398 domain-containing protein [Elusimicrobiota bacterium]|nr:DUF4398 domain-containing protein [Elusimicrobiota bacterium]